MSDPWTPAEHVYGELLRRHMYAMRDGDDARRERLWTLIEAFRLEFPDAAKTWEDRYGKEPDDGLTG